MKFTLTVTVEQVNLIFAGLNELKHGATRATFDALAAQIQQQEAQAAQANAAAPAPVEAVGLSD